MSNLTESAVRNIKLIKGDNSNLYEFALEGFPDLSSLDWRGDYTIRKGNVSGDVLLQGILSKNTDNTAFLFILTPTESETLPLGSLYLSIQVANAEVLPHPISSEIVQCQLTVVAGGVKDPSSEVPLPDIPLFVRVSDYTAEVILDKVKTVGGAGSGLDADTVDGLHASDFATASQGTKADAALPASYFTPNNLNNIVIPNIATMLGIDLTLGSVVQVKEYAQGSGSGVLYGNIVSTGVEDGGSYIKLNNDLYFEQLFKGSSINVAQFGASINLTDNSATITNAIAYCRSLGFGFSTELHFNAGTYVHTSTLILKGVTLVGAGNLATRLRYSNLAGGVGIKHTDNDLTDTIRWGGIRNIYIGDEAADGADVSLDITGGSYCTYDNFVIQSRRPNAVCIKGVGNTGESPYFNAFSNYALFGGVDATQTGVLFDQGIWSGGSNGANANVFTNQKRAASLASNFNIRSGFGNLGTNISAESIYDAMFIFNDIAASVTGTATSATTGSITDLNANLAVNEYINSGVRIVSGTGVGQARMLISNTATTMDTAPAWGTLPDSTSIYEIVKGRAAGNKFTNIRMEGLHTQNPDFIRNFAGSRDNSVAAYDVQSLGTGKIVNDKQQEPTNKFTAGSLVVLNETVTVDGSVQQVWPRVSVFGGVFFGRIYSIESMTVSAVGHTLGVTTITLDAGGVNTGDGVPSLSVAVSSSNKYNIFTTPIDYVRLQSRNTHTFLSVAPDTDVPVGVVYNITVAFKIVD